MKKKLKLLGIIALVVVIGFSMAACDFGTGDDNGNDGGGNDGGGGGNRTITIRNNTGYTLEWCWIKPSTSSDWGSYTSLYIYNGESKSFNLPTRISNNSYCDIRFDSPGSNYYSKYYVSVSNGTTITFTNSDFDDGNKNPKITIHNLSGVSLNSCYIKPSSSSDWGISLGSVGNNSMGSITLPFSLANFSTFDIQMRSSSPDNTFTKNNVTVSNGMLVVYSPLDTDNQNLIPTAIIFKNNTGYTLEWCWIKPSTSSDWGSYTSLYIYNGESKVVTLPPTIPNSSLCDIRFDSPGSNYYRKSNVSVSYGMTVTFTISDLE